MTAQFHEGQEVEVRLSRLSVHREIAQHNRLWRAAKIVHESPSGLYHVQFHDGTRAVFDAAHIRAVRPAHNDHFTSDYECADWNSE